MIPVDFTAGREQPRCANCWHRRIHHYALTRARYYGKGGGQMIEEPCTCSYWVDEEFTRCGCETYEPIRWRPVL